MVSREARITTFEKSAFCIVSDSSIASARTASASSSAFLCTIVTFFRPNERNSSCKDSIMFKRGLTALCCRLPFSSPGIQSVSRPITRFFPFLSAFLASSMIAAITPSASKRFRLFLTVSIAEATSSGISICSPDSCSFSMSASAFSI